MTDVGVSLFFPCEGQFENQLQQIKDYSVVEQLRDKLSVENNLVCFDYSVSGSRVKISDSMANRVLGDVIPTTNWTKLCGLEDSDLEKVRFLLNNISPATYTPFTRLVARIPELRQLSSESRTASDWSGRGFIDELARMQNPGGFNVTHDQLVDSRQKFQTINKFVQEVTNLPDATLHIPYDRSTILLDTGMSVQPLESLGSGMHEVIQLALVSTLLQDSVVCLEEPEMHLHPQLQKRLLNYLDKTSNQYFISTHSAHFIDHPNAAIFKISHSDTTGSLGDFTVTEQDKFNVCTHLGYRASELMQTNCILWVEGPSDAVYLRAWLREAAPSLSEGAHFTIMFYGGSLQKYLTGQDNVGDEYDEEESNECEEVFENLTSLLKLNRNLVMLVDSDFKTIQPAKRKEREKLKLQIEQAGGLFVATYGETIENYVKVDVFNEIRRKVHTRSDFDPIENEFSVLTKRISKRSKSFVDIRKVKIAELVARADAPFRSDMELAELLVQVITYIRVCNGLLGRPHASTAVDQLRANDN